MTGPTWISPTWIKWRSRLLLTGFTALLAVAALTTTAPPARAFFVGIGVPCCGWGPGPYWGYPPPYAYYPPSAYPPSAYYPPPGYYPPPAASAPSAYTPAQPTPGYPPASGYVAPGATAVPANPAATPRITYTSKPAFTNSAGQSCREYKTTDGGRDIFGTACKQTDGQWRVVN
jgi:hypothetical protein